MGQIHKDIKKQIDKYERGKSTFSEAEIDDIMPKVIEFYNNHPEDQDVYRDVNGVILLIQTPKQIINKENKTINKLKGYAPFGNPDADKKDWNYLLQNCKFRISGEIRSIGIFGTQTLWYEIEDIYNKKAFVKANKLDLKYKKLGSEVKALNLTQFLKLLELDDLDEIDESEYIIFYSVNITQVIK